jgi:hypothetical protein
MEHHCAVCQRRVDPAADRECPACGASTAFVRLWAVLPVLEWSPPTATGAGVVWNQTLSLCVITPAEDYEGYSEARVS